MKSILLAAAAMIAVPALAQTTTPPPTSGGGQTTGSMTPTDPATTTAPADPSTAGSTDQSTMPPTGTAPTDQSAPAPADQSMSTPAPAPTQPMATDSGAADPAGGYQPSQPATSGTPAPGATVRFQQAPDPATAYPPPAALDHYPPCKKGQYDNCMQTSGSSHSRHTMRRHHK